MSERSFCWPTYEELELGQVPKTDLAATRVEARVCLPNASGPDLLMLLTQS